MSFNWEWIKSLGCVYCLSDDVIPPKLANNKPWYAFRFGIKMIGEGEFQDGIPKIDLPSFNIVATDRDAAKVEMMRQVDIMFDWFEENRK